MPVDKERKLSEHGILSIGVMQMLASQMRKQSRFMI